MEPKLSLFEGLQALGDYDAMNAHDVQWLPDGSGFLFSLFYVDLGFYSNIFKYDFSTADITQLTNFPGNSDQIIGANELSISPYGDAVVFEWVTDTVDSDSSLWLMSLNGSNLRKLIDHAGRPAWGRTPAAPTPRAYLPLSLK